MGPVTKYFLSNCWIFGLRESIFTFTIHKRVEKCYWLHHNPCDSNTTRPVHHPLLLTTSIIVSDILMRIVYIRKDAITHTKIISISQN